ncbi:uncharacterized protein LOC125037191 [Penaeus chinensis]|uniref:uncharacterized protein LOC125037191 n=1 Tax=Penaeus chinensis TaxID=139456 RepID=UPI001FB80EA3|nr:uncharacterized protein LOC125037191 [Penaeus chinensis]
MASRLDSSRHGSPAVASGVTLMNVQGLRSSPFLADNFVAGGRLICRRGCSNMDGWSADRAPKPCQACQPVSVGPFFSGSPCLTRRLPWAGCQARQGAARRAICCATLSAPLLGASFSHCIEGRVAGFPGLVLAARSTALAEEISLSVLWHEFNF